MDILGINPLEILGGGDEKAPKSEGQSDGGLLEGVPLLGDAVDWADDAGLFEMAGGIAGNMFLPGLGGIAGKKAGEIVGDML